MGRTAFAILASLILTAAAGDATAQTSFAILPLESEGEVSAEDREAAEAELYRHLIDSGRYRIVDRNRIRTIMEEQSLQTTGATGKEKAVEIDRKR